MVQKIHLNSLLDAVNVIGPLCLKLPQMIAYVRKFEGNKTMSFKIWNK